MATSKKLTTIYASHDALLFPSLHDSSGNVVLEAMSHGLPVICLDLGGPGIMVDESCGQAIKTDGRSYDKVAEDLSKALVAIANNPEHYKNMSVGVFARAKEYEWSKIVKNVYAKVDPK